MGLQLTRYEDVRNNPSTSTPGGVDHTTSPWSSRVNSTLETVNTQSDCSIRINGQHYHICVHIHRYSLHYKCSSIKEYLVSKTLPTLNGEVYMVTIYILQIHTCVAHIHNAYTLLYHNRLVHVINSSLLLTYII